jgi:hypothetical protein
MKRAGYPSSSGGGGDRGLHKNSYVLFFLTISALVVLQLWTHNNNRSSNCIHALTQHPAAATAAADTLYHSQSPVDVLIASTAASGAASGSISASNASVALDHPATPPFRCAHRRSCLPVFTTHTERQLVMQSSAGQQQITSPLSAMLLPACQVSEAHPPDSGQQKQAVLRGEARD